MARKLLSYVYEILPVYLVILMYMTEENMTSLYPFLTFRGPSLQKSLDCVETHCLAS